MAHLENITLNKFRVFNEEFSLDIHPLTFLTGPNSSGKSSIFKSLLLLKSNHNSSLQVLDFSGKDHNLGSFEATRNKIKDEKEEIYFTLTSNVSDNIGFMSSTFMKEPITTRRSVFHILHELDSKDHEKIKIRLGYRKVDTSGKISEISLYQYEDKEPFLNLTIAKDESLSHSMKFNLELIRKNKILRNLFFKRLLPDEFKFTKQDKVKTYYTPSKFKILESTGAQFYDEPILIFGKLFEQFTKDLRGGKVSNELGLNRHDFLFKLPLQRILKDFSALLDNTEYLEAVRANTKRLYTNDSQGTSFNDLILDFKSRDISKEATAFLNKWLKKLEIAEKIIFKNIEGVATSIYLVSGKNEIALADLGYGVTQVIPILLRIAMEQPIRRRDETTRIVKKLMLLEEPETNLHPKLQSILADLLVDSLNTFEIRFIVETHSEYLIRKMQILTAEKIVEKEETAIYYFINPEKVSEKQKQVTKISINHNGSLSDEFGEGFFDEATNLKFELLKKKTV
ncbi:DUF3696 domain-containing protein [Pedobacter namyangjuensis]|uniref:DUF3696 domain-containing protein n=1 Tax=Pedobacter namyangjuensis TaxID=600626 RepID=UPI000DE54F06|nr:DUF3696 domain-containing protein [Pedobacter namyangjuensis]